MLRQELLQTVLGALLTTKAVASAAKACEFKSLQEESLMSAARTWGGGRAYRRPNRRSTLRRSG